MTAQNQRLLSDALLLPEKDRAELASLIIASLDGPPDPDAESLWAEEIARRVQEFEKDPSRAEDWEVVKARIKQKLWGSKSAS
ncbi:MAG: addiction module protein [Planctomycetes bacterium]|nr:addiction module protein [Planctomycetota bacterium]